VPAGKAWGGLAEFERAMIQERVRAGLRRAKAQGTKSGKPCGRPKVEASTETAIKAALATGDSDSRKVGTVQWVKAEMATA
jgi:DNA invertase Pin-like site-specific DNA recombinase